MGEGASVCTQEKHCEVMSEPYSNRGIPPFFIALIEKYPRKLVVRICKANNASSYTLGYLDFISPLNDFLHETLARLDREDISY